MFMDCGSARRIFDLQVCCGWIAVPEVFLNGVVQEIGFLRDDADQTSKVLKADVSDVNTIDGNRARERVMKPWNEEGHRSFASTARTDKGHTLSRLCGKGYVVKG